MLWERSQKWQKDKKKDKKKKEEMAVYLSYPCFLCTHFQASDFLRMPDQDDFLRLQIPVLSFFFCLFAISWAAPAAYGGSQARGQIGAVATGLRQSHSNEGSEPHLRPTPQTYTTAHSNAGSLTH